MKSLFLISMMLPVNLLLAQGKFSGGNGDGFAVATITNIVLPLQIVHFTVYPTGTSVKADLSIRSTEAVCGIVLEKSVNGTRFEATDSVHAATSGFMQADFVLNDPSPGQGILYYRMKIIRCNESFVVSKVILFNTGNKGDMFYTTGNMIHYNVSANGCLELLNDIGQLVLNKQISKGAGQLLLFSFNSGIYFVRFGGGPATRVFIY